ncbi:complexed with cef1p [Clonorchis sinensis]|uniref:Complexed with cef1p n=1 Tax=Clonorchis sinensis TaxID=79923 RepID=A0A3R7H715_CLOSI|nr:complexed with cef1p [Clonorchis sinensis]
MTTAGRPTWDSAKGGRGKWEGDLSAMSKQYSVRDLPSHTKLKVRQEGQGRPEDLQGKDFKRVLEEKEKRLALEKAGKAEQFADIFKCALSKAEWEWTMTEFLDKFLLNYRATPNPQFPDVGKPMFRPGNRVLIRNCGLGHPRWTVGVVLESIGQLIYSVQLLHLNLSPKTFELSMPAPIATASHVPSKTDPLLQPRRRTGHAR